ncbi:hypothetical protein BDV97DRAFT_300731 [Delphinella strobiligena]|nr:hypothetical protein BDV97DRAFT_300731 [Delphinella strobiligena]
MVFKPSGPISFTKTTLSYPIYTTDFDPYNRGYLVVAGGGGEGRSGTVLDTAQRGTLDTVTEIELSRDEDSVTSIANLGSRDGLIALAGINSSEADQKSGKNEHLRTFQIKYPKKKRPGEPDDKQDDSAEASITFAGKVSLFKPATGPKPETYQRILRLSPAFKRESGNRRIGAIATGLAKESEIVVFDATRTPPRQSEIISRIPIRYNQEAADLDITETDTNTFSIAWCTDYDVYEQSIMYNFASGKADMSPPSPRKIHSLPLREGANAPPRSKYRSIRWLTDEDILLVSNLPNKKGAELQILHLYPSGPAMILFQKILPSHIKQAVGLDVCGLDYDSNGNRQIVVALAGQDISLIIYTVDYNGLTRTFSPFKTFNTLRDLHPLQMTSLRFSPFHSPTRAPASNPEDVKGVERKPGATIPVHPGPQYIKLATASMGNTVVVDTLALKPLYPSKPDSRYVLSHPSDAKLVRNAFIFVISFVVLVSAILMQSLFFPDSAPVTALLPIPQSMRDALSKPANVADSLGRGGKQQIEVLASAGQKIKDLLHLHFAPSSADAEKKAIIVRDSPSTSIDGSNTDLSLDVIPDREQYLREDTQARNWDQLADHEKETWRRRLVAAGHWTVEEGETVLKGILFSSWAGFVGGVAGEVIREL